MLFLKIFDDREQERELLDLLLKVAAHTLRDAPREACRGAPGEPGIIAVLHTTGNRLNWNPHVHMIATDGCFGAGDTYQVCGFLPYSDLNHRWQRNLLTALVDAEIIPAGFAARVATWYPKGFITHSHTKDHRRDPDVMGRLLVSAAPPGGRGAHPLSTRPQHGDPLLS